MNTKEITEIIAYSIKPEVDTATALQLIRSIITKYEGFISITTLRHLKEPNTYVDLVKWVDATAYHNAAKLFHEDPQFKEVGAAFEETKFFAPCEVFQS